MSDLITLSTVKDMGFTPALISALLPEPVLKPNPYYRSAAPMKLWERTTVETAMLTPEFLAASAKREKRKAAARKAVETKREQIKAEFSGYADGITVKVVPLDELRRLTIEAKQAWYDYQWDEYGWEYHDMPKDAYSADNGTVARWMVNYIRHNLTEYEESLFLLKGRVGKGVAYNTYKCAILDKIAAAYPELAAECEYQKIGGETV